MNLPNAICRHRTTLLILAILAAGPARGAGPATVTLKAGQGLRLADATVLSADRPCDVKFECLPPGSGGLRPQFNGMSRQMEWRPEAKIDRNTPVLSALRLRDFVDAPVLGALTTGDLAASDTSLYLSGKSRHWLVQDDTGDAYLLHGQAAGTDDADPKAWSLNVTVEKVTLPLGEAGGKKNPPLPDRLLYRNNTLRPKALWCDLPTGTVSTVADGLWPTAAADRSVAVRKNDTEWEVQDRDGETLATVRVEPELLDAVLSPDGKLLAGTSKLPTTSKFMDMEVPGPDATALRVVTLDSREVARFMNAVDAAWTPAGTLIAAPVEGPGLLQCDLTNGTAAPLASILTNAGHPAVSPDGKTVAYVSNGRAYTVDLAGGRPKSVWKDARPQRWPVFSPDGRFIALISEATVRVIDRATGDMITPVTRAGWPLGTDNTSRLCWTK